MLWIVWGVLRGDARRRDFVLVTGAVVAAAVAFERSSWVPVLSYLAAVAVFFVVSCLLDLLLDEL